MIIHCMKKHLWDERKNMKSWGDEELEKDGFIHCCTVEYLWRVLPLFENNEEEYVLLCLDENKLDANIRYEDTSSSGRFYPHIYGTVNNSAVTMVLDYLRDEDGHYIKNPEFINIEDK